MIRMTMKQETTVTRSSILIALFSLGMTLLVSTAPPAWADLKDVDVESGYQQHEVEIGYRAVSSDDNPGRALEYDYQHSSMTGRFDVTGSNDWGHFNLDSSYLNEKDYSAEAYIDTASRFRLNLYTQSFFHNLDHIPYELRSDTYEFDNVNDPINFPADAAVPEPIPGVDPPTVEFTENNPGEAYGVRVRENQAELRYKPKAFPAHVTLGYWSFEKTGDKQMRWLDEGNGQGPGPSFCVNCHLQSKTRDIDRVTEEFSASVDSHLGPIDLILEQVFRQFRDREPIPSDQFGSHILRPAPPAPWEHDEDPDSRYVATTIKAHSSLSGGLVAAASATIAERENRSDLADVSPVESETDLFKGAADLTWIPSGKWTVNLRYRYLDMENDNSTELTNEARLVGGIPVVLDPRDNIDLTQANYITNLTFRPSPKTSFKGEFEYREIHRSNTGGPQSFSGFALIDDPVWELPEDEAISRYKLSFFARPLPKKRLKLSGYYQYRHSNDPAYGTSIEDGHSAFVKMDYAPSLKWGSSLSARYTLEKSKDYATVIDDGASDKNWRRDRDRDTQGVTAMAWTNPSENTSLTFYYGFLRTDIEQDILFGTADGFDIRNPDVDYDQTVHTATATIGWRLLQSLNFTGTGRYIRSEAEYDPDFTPILIGYDSGEFPATATPEGLKEISQIDIVQYGINTGLTWYPTDQWTCGINYSFDRYDDRREELLDGTVQTYMASLSRSW